MDQHGEASTLENIGIGLYELGEYADALPILRRCTTVEPDNGCCFVDMGESFERLGQTQDAIKAYRQAIGIGGYNTLNATCIKAAKEWLAHLEGATGAPSDNPTITQGTAFFVSGKGYLLTNAHVVTDCKRIQIRDWAPLHLVSADEDIDLALLKENWDDDPHPVVATFRMSSPRVGDTAIVFGFPLIGLLSTEGNLSTGTVAARAGLRNDPRFIQITAPVQPGNSGGPVLDSAGDVVGVVVAKLDAIKIAQLTGDIPENVNFAIGVPEVIRFLESNHVSPSVETRRSIIELKTADVADRAEQFTVAIECTK
jgi:S1-C subfamily serine protease